MNLAIVWRLKLVACRLRLGASRSCCSGTVLLSMVIWTPTRRQVLDMSRSSASIVSIWAGDWPLNCSVRSFIFFFFFYF